MDYQYTMAAAGTLFIKEANISITLCEIAAADLPDFEETGTHMAFFDLDRLISHSLCATCGRGIGFPRWA